ncbi:hypothetical protein D3C75_943520 [compost metagenome]
MGDYYADQFRGKAAGWSGKSSAVYGTPTYYVMAMYANRELDQVVPCRTECGSFRVSSPVPGAPRLEDLPELDVVACRNASGNKLTMFVVNRSLEDTAAEIWLDGFAGSGTARLLELTADDPEAFNSVEHPERVACVTHEIPIAEGRMTCMLRASSVYALEASC